MAAEDDKLEVVPDRAIEVRETRTLFAWSPLRQTTSAAPAGSPSSRPTRRTRPDRLRPCTTPSGAIGGIRISPSVIPSKRRRPMFSAM
jgi:hypothetical protein